MIISEILAAIERFAAPELQEDYDNAGLLTGKRNWECTGVLCTLDVTEEVLEEATERGCNLVLAHHPVIFKGIKKLNGNHYVDRVLIKAIKGDIAIYAAHTNLDNVLLGVSGRMASLLGLQQIEVLLPKRKMLRRLITFAPIEEAAKVRKALFDAGAGHIGQYSECSFNTNGTGTFKAEEGANPFVGEVGKQHEEKETKIEIVYPFYLEEIVVKALVSNHPYEEVAYDIFTMNNVHLGIGSGVVGLLPEPMEEPDFLRMVSQRFSAPAIRHSAFRGRPVRKVALCGGSGAFLIPRALSSGADAYLTADLKYHEFFEADGRMLLADLGHYETERCATDLLYDLVVQKFPTFAVLKSAVNTNPVHYWKEA